MAPLTDRFTYSFSAVLKVTDERQRQDTFVKGKKNECCFTYM